MDPSPQAAATLPAPWQPLLTSAGADTLDPLASFPPHGGGETVAVADLQTAHALLDGGRPTRCGRHRLVEAEQHALRRRVRLRVSGPSPEARRRFLNEARVRGLLEHPHILGTHRLEEDAGGRLLLIEPAVSGRSWEEALRGGADTEAMLQVLLQVAQAIAFAHAHGVLHLDLKPAHVLLGSFGAVTVRAWSLACFFRVPLAGCRTPYDLELPSGPPVYLAPEHARGERDLLGPASDVYALGGILYRLVAGRLPRDGDLRAVLAAAASGDLPDLAPCEDPQLRKLLRRALAPRPEDRLPDAEAFVSALARWMRTRRSRALEERTAQLLTEVETRAHQPDRSAAARSALYQDLARVVEASSAPRSCGRGTAPPPAAKPGRGASTPKPVSATATSSSRSR